MIDKVELALNSAQCIKQSNHIGRTVYHNICDGSQRVVEWGGIDWLLGIGVILTVIALVVAAIVLVVSSYFRW